MGKCILEKSVRAIIITVVMLAAYPTDHIRHHDGMGKEYNEPSGPTYIDEGVKSNSSDYEQLDQLLKTLLQNMPAEIFENTSSYKADDKGEEYVEFTCSTEGIECRLPISSLSKLIQNIINKHEARKNFLANRYDNGETGSGFIIDDEE